MEEPISIIQPGRGWASLRLGEVWRYRELLVFMVMREVQGRYRQMAFGPLWIIIQPLVNMVVMSIVFGGFAKLPSEGWPYPIFVYVALLPWQFFATGLRNSATSLLNQQHIISKVYFPRLVIPLAALLSAFVDFLASAVVLAGMLVYFHVPVTWRILTLPLFLLLAAGTALSMGLWLAGLAVRFHDVSIGLTLGLTVWQYLTPVAYSSSLVSPKWQKIYQLNPMTGVVEGFRWALLGVGIPPAWNLAVTTLVVCLLLVTGLYYFRYTERTIVDVI
jgi:lipopolysaccharide transport system permease protein